MGTQVFQKSGRNLKILGARKGTEINPLNAELNPICHLLALLEGATVVVVSRLRVNLNTDNPLILEATVKVIRPGDLGPAICTV